MASDAPTHTVLDSSFPVLLPRHDALFMNDADFQRRASSEPENNRAQKAPFLAGLEKHELYQRTTDDPSAENKMLTANGDVTNISSQNALVDLFYDLGENTAGRQLKTLLDVAWKEDAALTLKIIFNARSIHLGKSNRVAAYKAFGWLAQEHPLTLLTNLPWLVRPVIAKKAPKSDDGETEKMSVDEDFDMIGVEEADPDKAHDVRHGLSHGYWKDLLNLVVFAANNQLRVDGDPDALYIKKPDNSKVGKNKRNWDQATAKEASRTWKKDQNNRVQRKIIEDPFYRAIHFTVARLFTKQMKEDKVLLDSGKKFDLKKLSLAAKWSPTFSEFHDKHTFILSSIAEALLPDPISNCSPRDNREHYLRLVREVYRKEYASPLRKALSVVERDIAANTFSNIEYSRVPSLAMDRYTGLFMKKDMPRFLSYIEDPSNSPPNSTFNATSIDGQWTTLVQRVRDAGTLTSSIALCDVSGSMDGPVLKDSSVPMDSAIGLSLLISSVTAAPFGGGFINFSSSPTYLTIKPDQGLVDTVKYMESTPWGGSTNFTAVFEDVILPMAVKNQLKQDDMVKQVKYANAGYVMPRLIFWNLAASATGKPTTMYDGDTCLVSGYSQGMLRAFLEEGAFELGEEEVEVEIEGEDGMVEIRRVEKGVDPLETVRKAVGGRAYGMLEVVD
ncbi:hypothetical protein HBI24_012600 [Parastagonospora nodorum]|nr:hypothetical protein HBH47_066930 [Parastagonospora nodorum]KAH4188641.1 hypothetical protein HBH42_148570 [Parastagonospora nodorum]KAH4823433.1 hypothetical protein HBH61_001040 [Parastagonospora nodorum]KAH4994615.1 hypothetical protein HBI76_000400 [Parastagonospora nodorum]KAH5045005.1 hypothetical protein HBI75_010950 [Parastagonospora nodorum]